MTVGEHARARSYRLWTLLLFLGGIDGFKLLEPLRELGARPFFIVFIVFVGLGLARKRMGVNASGALFTLGIVAVSTLGFVLFGSALPPFGDKTPGVQFGAHCVLFLVGFSPIWLRWREPLEEAIFIKAAWTALLLHVAFIAVDGAALLANVARPFEDSFLGSVGRAVPTGLFSEPSYAATYMGILLPVVLRRSRPSMIVVVSTVAGLLFFLGDVRSFFVVYTAGLLALILVRWGVTWKVLLAGGITLAFVGAAATALSLLSVEDSLSSAYRLGNAISYFNYAVAHNLLVGDGFGSAHFLYLQLDFPDFMYLSSEFNNMLDGSGNRVPVFNLWVRLFIEIGILPTLVLIGWLVHRFLRGRLSPVAKIYAVPTFVCCLSADSYIYGMLTIGMVLLFSIRVDATRVTVPVRRRKVGLWRRRSRTAQPSPGNALVPSK